MPQLARDTGLRRESLDKAPGSGAKPERGTLMKIIQVPGIQVTAGAALG